jgi:hypothetical protein
VYILQPVQDGAVLCDSVALFPQGSQLALQLLQLANASGDLLEVLVQYFVDLLAVVTRCVLETGERPNLVERHVERAAMADEREALSRCSSPYTR